MGRLSRSCLQHTGFWSRSAGLDSASSVTWPLLPQEAKSYAGSGDVIELDRVFKVDRRRVTFAALFLVLFVVTEIGRKAYRPYIYSHGIFDFWIADTIGNFTGTMAIIFFEVAMINPAHKQGRVFVFFTTVGLIVYELAQYFSPRSVLDWRDIVATLIAGLISWGVYESISRRRM